MGTEKLFTVAFKAAQGLADSASASSPEAVANYCVLVASTAEAKELLGELDHELCTLLSAMNTDKDGGMFLCEEAVPNFNRVVELREEINALATRLAGTDQSG